MAVQSGQKFPSLNQTKAINVDTGGAVDASVNVSFGTFTANGATPVTVTNSAVTANSIIIFTLKTAAGTVSPSMPNVLTITPGTGFTVGGTNLDTSVYNYVLIG